MVWIIGEYAERIDNADELLESFLDSFAEETAQVQLQLLTATVKLFLKQPDTSQDMVQRVLNLATEDSDNPDLRDRGYIYWRLLSSDPEAARAVVLSEKPEIGDDTFTLEPSLLDDLMSQIATLASIYHKPPEAFVVKSMQHIASTAGDEDEDVEEEALGEGEEEGQGIDEYSSYGNQGTAAASASATAPKAGGGDLLDLLDDSPPIPPPSAGAPLGAPGAVKKVPLVAPEVGHGVFMSGAMTRINDQLTLLLDVGNTTGTPIQTLAIQLNKNTFGIAPVSPQVQLSAPVANGRYAVNNLPFNCQLSVTPL
jgi:AP-1 complex subunit beta-1